MKQRIFSKGKGWYISATNYKDKNDKAFVSLHFTNNNEPIINVGNQGYAVMDIDIIEWRLNSYKNKVGMTIFKYYPVEEQQEAVRNEYTDEMRELPFY